MTRQSVFALGRQLVAGFISLAKLESKHGRQEIGQMLGGIGRAAILIGIALALLFASLIALLVAFILGLAALTGSPGWLVSLIVVVLLLVLAALFGWRGMRKIRIGPPEETMASVREEVAWAKRLIKRG